MDFITENIPIIIEALITILTCIVGFATIWQKTKDRVSAIEKKLSEHEKIHIDLDKKIESVNVINVTLAQIQTDIAWIKTELSKKE